MADTRDLRFRFIGEDSSLGSTMSGVSDKAAKLGKAVGIGAVAGIGLLVGALKGGAEEFKGNQEAMAQFTAGMASTRGAAKVSAASIQSLADSIEAKTGTDGAAVVSGAALLETFTKVRNEVGKGNDVFNRATQAGVDLAARGFGSVQSNAVLLGKALNDPVKGLSALGKQGITFTAAQKATIQSMVKTGDVLGAQKIILKEVEGQVGGSAAAYGKTLPGQLARASAAFDGIKETIFKAALPAITKLLTFVTDRLLPALQDLATKYGPRVSAFFTGTLVPALKTAGEAVSRVAGFLDRHRNAAKALGAVIVVLTVVTQAYSAVLAVQAAGGLLAYLRTLKLVTIATKVYTAVQWALDGALAVMTGPIGLIVIGVAALAAGLVIAYKHSETFRNVVNAAFRGVLGGVSAFLHVLQITFSALGHVPGFGWAKTAASAIGRARGEVDRLRDSLKQIPSTKTVTIKVGVNGVNTAKGAIAKLGRLDGRATGGPVAGGTPYIVGERGPELFVPSSSGQILNQQQLGAAHRSGVGSGDVHVTVVVQGNVVGQSGIRELSQTVASTLRQQKARGLTVGLA